MPDYQAEDIEILAKQAHNAYERAARISGWETNEATRVPWEDVPEDNKQCTRASVQAVMEYADLWVPKGAIFRITFFEDGKMEVQGDPLKSGPDILPTTLRLIADSVENGETTDYVEYPQAPT